MSTKQTAVQWFWEKIKNIEPSLEWYKFFEQAEEMEKKQIMQAVYDSMGTNIDPNMGRAEQYYNETFKTK